MGQQGGGDDPRWLLHSSGGDTHTHTTSRPHSQGSRGRGAFECGCGRPSINQQCPWWKYKLNSKFSTFSSRWREWWNGSRVTSHQYYQQQHHHSHQQQQQQRQYHHQQQKQKHQRQPQRKQHSPSLFLQYPNEQHPPPDHIPGQQQALPRDARTPPPRCQHRPAPQSDQWGQHGQQQQAMEQRSSRGGSAWWFPRGTSPTGWWAPTVLLSPAVAVFSSGVPQAWWWQLASRVFSSVRAWTQSEATDRGQLDPGWRAWCGAAATG